MEKLYAEAKNSADCFILFENKMLEYYLDPSKLSDEQWAIKVRQLERIRKMEARKS